MVGSRSKVKVKIGSSHKTLFFEYFLSDQLQTWCESSTWSATQLNIFEGRSRMTFMVSARVKYGVPQGQILKLQKPYRVVYQMKALDEHFPDQ
jgi:hypothetical protein